MLLRLQLQLDLNCNNLIARQTEAKIQVNNWIPFSQNANSIWQSTDHLELSIATEQLTVIAIREHSQA